MMRIVWYVLTLFMARAVHSQPAPRHPVTAPEAAIYAVLLDAVRPPLSLDTVVVVDSTAWLPAGFAQSWFGRRVDSMPPELPATLDRLTQVKQSTVHLSFGRPVSFVSDTSLRTIFSRGVAGGWAEFRRRYPNQHGYLNVSPVALTADSLDALVYYDLHCGGRCG